MEVSRIRALRGPNLWSRHTAIEAIVTCPPGAVILSANHPIEQRLRRIFPDVEHDGQFNQAFGDDNSKQHRSLLMWIKVIGRIL